ncbi:MAG: hypothetical protein KDA32_08380 [Phycisphaerales bacterium]|nr:hypothetical protein [Phycisphaerales bacterium]
MVIVAILALLFTSGQEVPVRHEPAPTPIAWEIELDFQDPHRIDVMCNGRQHTFWYVVYTARNTSDKTQQFQPTFQIVNEDLEVFNTDTSVPPVAFQAIRELHRDSHPELRHPTKAIGPIRRGDDYAVESVAIWRDANLSGNNFSIFVSGLSGETEIVANPAFDPRKPESVSVVQPSGMSREVSVNPRHFVLRKTLEIDYQLPGSNDTLHHAEPIRTGARWIMR